MLDNLAIIRRAIDEHQTIKRYIKLAGDTVSDQEALNALAQASTDWIPGQTDISVEQQNRLEQTLSLLDEGLKNHFAYEEKYLPPLLGELFMRALILDHEEIKKEIEEAKVMLAESKPGKLKGKKLLSWQSDIQEAINGICHLIEEHATREEVILDMAQRVLREKEQKQD